MFHLFKSHSLQKLAQHFSETFQLDPLNPLSPPWIIVQNNEIKEWLSLEIARQQQIAGNFRFIFPSEFLWVLYRLKNKDLPEVLPSDLNAMQWSLFELFSADPELLRSIPFYAAESDTPQKRFQLCARIADNFDQYQVYRPYMMEAWLQGRLVTSHKDEKWQAVLWKRLNDYWNKTPETAGNPRRSQAFSELMGWLDAGDDFIHEIPHQIYVFGLSHAPRPFLEIATQLGKQKDVFYYLRGGQADERFDMYFPEDLYHSWNKPQREHLNLLKELTANSNSKIKTETLPASSGSSQLDFTIHACHNKRREVEVLKDQILHFLDENPLSGAGDILVMVPDAESYSGVLETVFANDTGEPSLPVSRLSGVNRQSAEHTLSELFELLSGSFKASNVIPFLHLDSVQQHFSFSETELDQLEEWILENHIYWGLGEEFNSSYSWQKGVNQLFAGFSLEPEKLEVYRGLVPYTQLTSSDDADLSARFSRFVHLLKSSSKQIQQPKTITGWLNFTEQLVHHFIGGDEEGIGQTSRLLVQLNTLKDQVSLTNPEQLISFGLMKNWMQGQLETQSSGSARFGQGITVSSYIPYRSIPFAFIGVLGMNEGVFPRKAVRPEFDLIYAEPKAGDRILKEDDTYLFLETLEAGQKLHLSYQGKDQRTDANRLPSILIQQLLDALPDAPKEVMSKHSLHSFNKRYFRQGKPNSFSGSNQTIAERIENESKVTSPFIPKNFSLEIEESKKKIEIHDLIYFFTHPCKYLLENELDIREYDNFKEVIDREQFSLGRLEKYKLDDVLVESMSRRESPEKVFQFARAVPLLPESLEGEKAFAGEKQQIEMLLARIERYASGHEEAVEIDLNLDGVQLSGTISGLYGNTSLMYRPGKRREKHEIELWLKHLILLQSGIPISRSYFLSMDNTEIKTLELSTEQIAENPLQKYVNWFRSKNALHKKLAFFQKSSKAYAEEYLKKQDVEAATEKAEFQWEVSRYNQWADSADFYNQLVWRHQEPINTKYFKDNALQFWAPFFEAIREEGD